MFSTFRASVGSGVVVKAGTVFCFAIDVDASSTCAAYEPNVGGFVLLSVDILAVGAELILLELYPARITKKNAPTEDV